MIELFFSPVEDLIIDTESCGSFKVLVKDFRENYLNGENMLFIPWKDFDMLHTQIVGSDRLRLL